MYVVKKILIDLAEEIDVSKNEVYSKFLVFLKTNFKLFFPAENKSNTKSTAESREWHIKNNFKHFLNNTEYSLWAGKRAKYLILEEQPTFNLGSDQYMISMRGVAIISVGDDDYLLLVTSHNGGIKFDCLKIIGTQLGPVTDDREYARLQDCVDELRMYMINR